MSSPAPDISLVVACYDEEDSLPHLFTEVERLSSLAAERRLTLETVLVDDGSTDRTRVLLGDWARAGAGRMVLAHGENRGFGAAMRTGFMAARGKAIVSYDADAAYPIQDVLKLEEILRTEDADVASASPFLASGGAAAPWSRLCLSRTAATMYRMALRGRSGGLTAYTCAFRAYRREAVRGIAWRADGFLAAAEVISLLLLTRARVREAPSTLSSREHGRSSMRVFRVALAHLCLLARIALRQPPYTSASGLGGR